MSDTTDSNVSFLSEALQRVKTRRPTPLPEAIIARLLEAERRFMSIPSFVPGDIVVARKDSPSTSWLKDRPSLVLVTFREPGYAHADLTSGRAAERKNIVVLCIDADDEIAAFASDSAFFERWPREEDAVTAAEQAADDPEARR